MTDNTPTADELREAARHTETTAAEYGDLEAEPALGIGDAQNFARESPEGRAIRQASVVLHERAAHASATMLLLAEVMDDKAAEIPPAILAEMEPYLEAYRDARP